MIIMKILIIITDVEVEYNIMMTVLNKKELTDVV